MPNLKYNSKYLHTRRNDIEKYMDASDIIQKTEIVIGNHLRDIAKSLQKHLTSTTFPRSEEGKEMPFSILVIRTRKSSPFLCTDPGKQGIGQGQI